MQYNKTEGIHPDKIGPTVGLNTGKITLPSTILTFQDLGGQRAFRGLWHRYFSQCHAVIYLIDASNPDRLDDGWIVFDEVLTSPQISGVPLLLLANKQDADGSLTVQEIRENYEEWWGRKQNQNQLNARAQGGQDHHHSEANEEHRRMASLDVMGISALKGTGVRDAIDWIYIRVQTNRKRDEEDY
ncbi:ADP-ribosylation factor protein 3 [Serendipita sp. 411]|nr:ADP-ribosylation factor protein 3 [Serendipita sp. 411]